MTPDDLPERLASKIVPEPMSGCWLWTAYITKQGYAAVANNPRSRSEGAHRVVYELLVGPIPEGLELDHLCRNRACVSPWHLEAVTHRENSLRGFGVGALNGLKTHCPRGHPYDEEHTYLYPDTGYRRCKPCRLDSQRQMRQRMYDKRIEFTPPPLEEAGRCPVKRANRSYVQCEMPRGHEGHHMGRSPTPGHRVFTWRAEP